MAHTTSRGYLRKDVEKLYHPIQQHGIKAITETLDGTNTEEIKIFGDVASKISIQTTGTLVVDILISVNGQNWVDTTLNGTSTAIVSYETHNISAIKFVRTAGEGTVHILGSI